MPLAILVFTPKGNVPHVSATLMQAGLMLDHPTSVFDLTPILHRVKYYNPHSPPPGGSRATANCRSNPLPLKPFLKCNTPQVPSKSVEIQRNQVEDVFQKLRSEDDLKETSPGTCLMIYLAHQAIFPSDVFISSKVQTFAPPFIHIRKRRLHSCSNENRKLYVRQERLVRYGTCTATDGKM